MTGFGTRSDDGGMLGPAVDQAVGLMRGDIVDPHRHSIRHHMTRQPTSTDASDKGHVNREFDLCVNSSFRRHGVHDPLVELIAPRPALRPDQIFVDGDGCFGQYVHGPIIRPFAETRQT